MADTIFPGKRRTTLPGGYMGKILRVNLSARSTKDENLPEEPLLKKFIGGQSLATYILLKELPLEAQPYGVENKVVMMTGPITGTGFTPGGTKVTAVYLSPLTRHTLGRGAASGFWAVSLKAAGYDGIIVEGAASEPTYLFINEGKAELRDARRCWGKEANDTEDFLRAEVGIKDARVMCIGPAGEHLVPSAMLCNDYNHNAAHGGGAVFGAKKLKAIVVHGTARPPLHDRERLIEAGSRWRSTLAVRHEEEKRTAGHARDLGAAPNFNFRSTVIEQSHTEGFEQNRITLRPCFQCQRLCPWDVVLATGKHAGTLAHFNAGSEWLDTFYNLGVRGNEALYLAHRINNLGIECSHFSCGVAVAFEAWEKGLLDAEKTGGLRFEWGNVEVVERLLEMMARREGYWGNLLAEGPVAVAEAIGGEAPRWVVHTKKGTPALHDWRPHFGQMIRELVASGGMKPQGGGTANPPPDLRYREKWGPLDRDHPAGWAWSNALSEQYRQFCGIIGGCWFAQMHMKPDGLKSLVDSFNATTGWNFDLDQALEAGHRSAMLQTIFGTQRGWVAEHDWKDVGPRFLEPVPDGKYRGFTIAKWLPEMVYEYHRSMGRHEKTGRPFLDTLRRLGLEEFKNWAQVD
ncbi:MAG TPA: aldehyde ferredoxin oxidoreductase N-terminal domain-containing protein [Candidatus Acidoferrales bacterium]|nr:aldehyde ferredoxin oxidoreductase N-terminal domain-containing protein [Candidatus Acidoferrales bacterium]